MEANEIFFYSEFHGKHFKKGLRFTRNILKENLMFHEKHIKKGLHFTGNIVKKIPCFTAEENKIVLEVVLFIVSKSERIRNAEHSTY